MNRLQRTLRLGFQPAARSSSSTLSGNSPSGRSATALADLFRSFERITVARTRGRRTRCWSIDGTHRKRFPARPQAFNQTWMMPLQPSPKLGGTIGVAS